MRARSLLAVLLVIPLLLHADRVSGQHGSNTYTLAISGSVGSAERKAILSALHDQDATMIMSLSDDGHTAKVRTFVQLDLAMVQAEVAPFGLTVQWIHDPLPPGSTTKLGDQGDPDAHPEQRSSRDRHPEQALPEQR